MVAHGGGRVEQHRQKVLLHVPYLGGVLLQAVHDKLDVGAVQLQEAGTHHLMGEVRPGNPGGLTLRADGFHQQLHDLVQVLPIGPKPLFEAVILDILQNQLPITFHLCERHRFPSLRFRWLCRRSPEGNGIGN